MTREQRDELLQSIKEAKALDPAEQKAGQEQHAQRVQQFLVDCMRKQGFSYVAFTPPPPPGGTEGTTTPEEFVRQYGFGISTRIEQSMQRPQPVGPPVDDPNVRIRNGLSPSHRAAYDQAFHGCQDGARKEIGHPPGAVVVAGDTSSLRDQAAQQADVDARVVAATNAWTSCMAREGFSAPRRSVLITDFDKRVTPFRDAYADALRRNPNARLADALSPEQARQLAALQQQELKAAAADQRCDNGLSDLIAQVQQEKFEALLAGGR